MEIQPITREEELVLTNSLIENSTEHKNYIKPELTRYKEDEEIVSAGAHKEKAHGRCGYCWF